MVKLMTLRYQSGKFQVLKILIDEDAFHCKNMESKESFAQIVYYGWVFLRSGRVVIFYLQIFQIDSQSPIKSLVNSNEGNCDNNLAFNEYIHRLNTFPRLHYTS